MHGIQYPPIPCTSTVVNNCYLITLKRNLNAFCPITLTPFTCPLKNRIQLQNNSVHYHFFGNLESLKTLTYS